MKTIRILRFVTVGLLVCAIAVGWYASRTEPIDDFGPLGPFSFVSSTGQKVTDRDFSGQVCIYCCFFTNCTTQCPALTGVMAHIQNETNGLANLKLISLSVDPERDTPERLATYAQNFRADPKRWLFLTGQPIDIREFVVKQLKQGMEKNTNSEPGNEVLHSERLILVDGAGRIRGFFHGLDSNDVENLRRMAKRLHG